MVKNLTKDIYNIKRLFGSIEYYQPVIINVKYVHNYLSSKFAKTTENVDKELVHIKSHI